jgi:transcriptional regulator with XRE-family HTH domain
MTVPDVIYMPDIGKNIRRIREENNMTQLELSQRLHCTKQTISNYENGRRLPDVPTMHELAAIFGVPVGAIMGGEKPTEQSKPKEAESDAISKKVVDLIEDEVNARINEKMKHLQETNLDPDKWIALAPGFYDMDEGMQRSFRAALSNIWKTYHDLSTQQRKDEDQ